MATIVLLNNIDHADMRVAGGHAAAFGDAVNQMRVFPTEFEELQREYPILFRRDEDGAMGAVVLLGLDRDENLFLDDDGWHARYVPAIQRRGPFSIGLQPGEGGSEPMINVDLDDPRVGDPAGEPVFRRHGGNTPYLDGVGRALVAIYDGLDATAPFFAALDEHGLVQPVSIGVTVGEGRRYDVDEFHGIDRERFDALDGAALAALHRGGHLAPAIWVLSSLGNIDRIVALKNRREGSA